MFNIVPIQFIVLSWVQSITILGVASRYIRSLQWAVLGPWLLLATLSAWTLSAFTFVVEHDWPQALVLLVASALPAYYYYLLIESAKSECYPISETGILRAICDFYTKYPLSWIKPPKGESRGTEEQ
jgi:hypothetical protein